MGCPSHMGDEPAEREPTWASVSPQKRRGHGLRCPATLGCPSHMGDEPAEREPTWASVSPLKRRGRPTFEALPCLEEPEPDDVSISPRKGRAYDTGALESEVLGTSFSPKKMRLVPASRGALEHVDPNVLHAQAAPHRRRRMQVTSRRAWR